MRKGRSAEWGSPEPQRFFILVALLTLGIAIAGFAGTFFVPMAQGRFVAPPILFVHGGLAFAWVLLFVLQPSLIALGRYDVHTRMGLFGVLLALSLVATAPFVGLYQVQKELALGLGQTAISSFLGIFTSMAVFIGLVLAAVVMRKVGDVHKRLMLLATIIVSWPALFRFRHYFPSVPDPHIWFGVVGPGVLMAMAAVRDRVLHGRIHPVWLWLAPAVFAEQLLETVLFDTPGWRVAAQALYDVFA